MNKLLLTIFLILLALPAWAQPSPSPIANSITPGTDLSAGNVTATVGNTANTLAYRASWQEDVRNWFSGTSANCATDVSPAVNAAVTAGVTRIFMPANCTYIPTSNTTPSHVHIIGEDWNTSVITVTTRASQNVSLGAESIIENVAIIDAFCDTTANPGSTAKVCPVGKAINNSSSSVVLTNWVYESLFFNAGPTVTGPTGVVSTDTPQIADECSGAGTDCIYVGTGGAGTSGLRIVTSATGGGDNGLYILNGYLDATTTDSHYGIFLKEFSNYVDSGLASSIRIDRTGDGTNVGPSFLIDDTDSAGATNSTHFVNLIANKQSSGNLINLYQATTPFSGNVIQANAGNSGGTFTGNFLLFQKNGASIFNVSNTGATTISGSANSLTIQGSATTQDTAIVASGSDTNINIDFTPKGNGQLVTAGAYFGSNALVNVTGQFRAGSGSADYAQISGGSGAMTLATIGSDTNANMQLSPKGTGYILAQGAVVVGQTKFTTSGCGISATVGSGTAGTYTSGTTGTCTAAITMNGATGMTAPNGWNCFAADWTTPADAQAQTASSTTTATIAGTTVSGDVVHFSCQAY